MFISDVNGLGLQTAQGLTLTESFYWDLNDRTRAFSERLKAKAPDVRADMDQAGCYSAALHYLKAVADLGRGCRQGERGAATVARMKAMPTDDDAFGKGSIREDGRGLFPAYLFQVKSPAESPEAVGLLQADRHDSAERGLAAAFRGRLSPRA